MQNKKIFTLVEIIISIAILWILLSITIISFKSWFEKSRDAVKKADLNIISVALSNYKLNNWVYPKPDNYIEVTDDGWNIVLYQWFVGTGVFSKLSTLTKFPKDPYLNTYYWYSVSADWNAFQLLTWLERNEYSFFPTIYAYQIFSDMYPYLKGKFIGYLKYFSSDKKVILIKLPSMFLYTGSIITTWSKFIVSYSNRPYILTSVIKQDITPIVKLSKSFFTLSHMVAELSGKAMNLWIVELKDINNDGIKEKIPDINKFTNILANVWVDIPGVEKIIVAWKDWYITDSQVLNSYDNLKSLLLDCDEECKDVDGCVCADRCVNDYTSLGNTCNGYEKPDCNLTIFDKTLWLYTWVVGVNDTVALIFNNPSWVWFNWLVDLGDWTTSTWADPLFHVYNNEWTYIVKWSLKNLYDSGTDSIVYCSWVVNVRNKDKLLVYTWNEQVSLDLVACKIYLSWLASNHTFVNVPIPVWIDEYFNIKWVAASGWQWVSLSLGDWNIWTWIWGDSFISWYVYKLNRSYVLSWVVKYCDGSWCKYEECYNVVLAKNYCWDWQIQPWEECDPAVNSWCTEYCYWQGFGNGVGTDFCWAFKLYFNPYNHKAPNNVTFEYITGWLSWIWFSGLYYGDGLMNPNFTWRDTHTYYTGLQTYISKLILINKWAAQQGYIITGECKKMVPLYGTSDFRHLETCYIWSWLGYIVPVNDLTGKDNLYLAQCISQDWFIRLDSSYCGTELPSGEPGMPKFYLIDWTLDCWDKNITVDDYTYLVGTDGSVLKSRNRDFVLKVKGYNSVVYNLKIENYRLAQDDCWDRRYSKDRWWANNILVISAWENNKLYNLYVLWYGGSYQNRNEEDCKNLKTSIYIDNSKNNLFYYVRTKPINTNFISNFIDIHSSTNNYFKEIQAKYFSYGIKLRDGSDSNEFEDFEIDSVKDWWIYIYWLEKYKWIWDPYYYQTYRSAAFNVFRNWVINWYWTFSNGIYISSFYPYPATWDLNLSGNYRVWYNIFDKVNIDVWNKAIYLKSSVGNVFVSSVINGQIIYQKEIHCGRRRRDQSCVYRLGDVNKLRKNMFIWNIINGFFGGIWKDDDDNLLVVNVKNNYYKDMSWQCVNNTGNVYLSGIDTRLSGEVLTFQYASWEYNLGDIIDNKPVCKIFNVGFNYWNWIKPAWERQINQNYINTTVLECNNGNGYLIPDVAIFTGNSDYKEIRRCVPKDKFVRLTSDNCKWEINDWFRWKYYIVDSDISCQNIRSRGKTIIIWNNGKIIFDNSDRWTRKYIDYWASSEVYNLHIEEISNRDVWPIEYRWVFNKVVNSNIYSSWKILSIKNALYTYIWNNIWTWYWWYWEVNNDSKYVEYYNNKFITYNSSNFFVDKDTFYLTAYNNEFVQVWWDMNLNWLKIEGCCNKILYNTILAGWYSVYVNAPNILIWNNIKWGILRGKGWIIFQLNKVNTYFNRDIDFYSNSGINGILRIKYKSKSKIDNYLYKMTITGFINDFDLSTILGIDIVDRIYEYNYYRVEPYNEIYITYIYADKDGDRSFSVNWLYNITLEIDNKVLLNKPPFSNYRKPDDYYDTIYLKKWRHKVIVRYKNWWTFRKIYVWFKKPNSNSRQIFDINNLKMSIFLDAEELDLLDNRFIINGKWVNIVKNLDGYWNEELLYLKKLYVTWNKIKLNYRGRNIYFYSLSSGVYIKYNDYWYFDKLSLSGLTNIWYKDLGLGIYDDNSDLNKFVIDRLNKNEWTGLILCANWQWYIIPDPQWLKYTDAVCVPKKYFKVIDSSYCWKTLWDWINWKFYVVNSNIDCGDKSIVVWGRVVLIWIDGSITSNARLWTIILKWSENVVYNLLILNTRKAKSWCWNRSYSVRDNNAVEWAYSIMENDYSKYNKLYNLTLIWEWWQYSQHRWANLFDEFWVWKRNRWLTQRWERQCYNIQNWLWVRKWSDWLIIYNLKITSTNDKDIYQGIQLDWSQNSYFEKVAINSIYRWIYFNPCTNDWNDEWRKCYTDTAENESDFNVFSGLWIDDVNDIAIKISPYVFCDDRPRRCDKTKNMIWGAFNTFINWSIHGYNNNSIGIYIDNYWYNRWSRKYRGLYRVWYNKFYWFNIWTKIGISFETSFGNIFIGNNIKWNIYHNFHPRRHLFDAWLKKNKFYANIIRWDIWDDWDENNTLIIDSRYNKLTKWNYKYNFSDNTDTLYIDIWKYFPILTWQIKVEYSLDNVSTNKFIKNLAIDLEWNIGFRDWVKKSWNKVVLSGENKIISTNNCNNGYILPDNEEPVDPWSLTFRCVPTSEFEVVDNSYCGKSLWDWFNRKYYIFNSDISCSSGIYLKWKVILFGNNHKIIFNSSNYWLWLRWSDNVVYWLTGIQFYTGTNSEKYNDFDWVVTISSTNNRVINNNFYSSGERALTIWRGLYNRISYNLVKEFSDKYNSRYTILIRGSDRNLIKDNNIYLYSSSNPSYSIWFAESRQNIFRNNEILSFGKNGNGVRVFLMKNPRNKYYSYDNYFYNNTIAATYFAFYDEWYSNILIWNDIPIWNLYSDNEERKNDFIQFNVFKGLIVDGLKFEAWSIWNYYEYYPIKCRNGGLNQWSYNSTGVDWYRLYYDYKSTPISTYIEWDSYVLHDDHVHTYVFDSSLKYPEINPVCELTGYWFKDYGKWKLLNDNILSDDILLNITLKNRPVYCKIQNGSTGFVVPFIKNGQLDNAICVEKSKFKLLTSDDCWKLIGNGINRSYYYISGTLDCWDKWIILWGNVVLIWINAKLRWNGSYLIDIKWSNNIIYNLDFVNSSYKDAIRIEWYNNFIISNIIGVADKAIYLLNSKWNKIYYNSIIGNVYRGIYLDWSTNNFIVYNNVDSSTIEEGVIINWSYNKISYNYINISQGIGINIVNNSKLNTIIENYINASIAYSSTSKNRNIVIANDIIWNIIWDGLTKLALNNIYKFSKIEGDIKIIEEPVYEYGNYYSWELIKVDCSSNVWSNTKELIDPFNNIYNVAYVNFTNNPVWWPVKDTRPLCKEFYIYCTTWDVEHAVEVGGYKTPSWYIKNCYPTKCEEWYSIFNNRCVPIIINDWNDLQLPPVYTYSAIWTGDYTFTIYNPTSTIQNLPDIDDNLLSNSINFHIKSTTCWNKLWPNSKCNVTIQYRALSTGLAYTYFTLLGEKIRIYYPLGIYIANGSNSYWSGYVLDVDLSSVNDMIRNTDFQITDSGGNIINYCGKDYFGDCIAYYNDTIKKISLKTYLTWWEKKLIYIVPNGKTSIIDGSKIYLFIEHFNGGYNSDLWNVVRDPKTDHYFEGWMLVYKNGGRFNRFTLKSKQNFANKNIILKFRFKPYYWYYKECCRSSRRRWNMLWLENGLYYSQADNYSKWKWWAIKTWNWNDAPYVNNLTPDATKWYTLEVRQYNGIGYAYIDWRFVMSWSKSGGNIFVWNIRTSNRSRYRPGMKISYVSVSPYGEWIYSCPLWSYPVNGECKQYILNSWQDLQLPPILSETDNDRGWDTIFVIYNPHPFVSQYIGSITNANLTNTDNFRVVDTNCPEVLAPKKSCTVILQRKLDYPAYKITWQFKLWNETLNLWFVAPVYAVFTGSGTLENPWRFVWWNTGDTYVDATSCEWYKIVAVKDPGDNINRLTTGWSSLYNGYYLIDPDWRLNKYKPIVVYCDMTSIYPWNKVSASFNSGRPEDLVKDPVVSAVIWNEIKFETSNRWAWICKFIWEWETLKYQFDNIPWQRTSKAPATQLLVLSDPQNRSRGNCVWKAHDWPVTTNYNCSEDTCMLISADKNTNDLEADYYYWLWPIESAPNFRDNWWIGRVRYNFWISVLSIPTSLQLWAVNSNFDTSWWGDTKLVIKNNTWYPVYIWSIDNTYLTNTDNFRIYQNNCPAILGSWQSCSVILQRKRNLFDSKQIITGDLKIRDWTVHLWFKWPDWADYPVIAVYNNDDTDYTWFNVNVDIASITGQISSWPKFRIWDRDWKEIYYCFDQTGWECDIIPSTGIVLYVPYISAKWSEYFVVKPDTRDNIVDIIIANKNDYDLTWYQVRIDLSTISWSVDTWPNFDLVDDDGNSIPFCREQSNGECWTNQSWTIIWAKLDLKAGNIKRLYLESSDVNKAVSGGEIFEFYDDFNDGIIDTDKWEYNYEFIETWWYIVINAHSFDNRDWKFIKSVRKFVKGITLDVNWIYNWDWGGWDSCGRRWWTFYNGFREMWLGGYGNNSLCSDNSNYLWIWQQGNNGVDWDVTFWMNWNTILAGNAPYNYKFFDIIKWWNNKGCVSRKWIDKEFANMWCFDTIINTGMYIYIWVRDRDKNHDREIKVDWIRIRKYADIEPIVYIRTENDAVDGRLIYVLYNDFKNSLQGYTLKRRDWDDKYPYISDWNVVLYKRSWWYSYLQRWWLDLDTKWLYMEIKAKYDNYNRMDHNSWIWVRFTDHSWNVLSRLLVGDWTRWWGNIIKDWWDWSDKNIWHIWKIYLWDYLSDKLSTVEFRNINSYRRWNNFVIDRFKIYRWNWYGIAQ